VEEVRKSPSKLSVSSMFGKAGLRGLSLQTRAHTIQSIVVRPPQAGDVGCSFWTPRQFSLRYASTAPPSNDKGKEDAMDFMEDSDVWEEEEVIGYDTSRKRSHVRGVVPICPEADSWCVAES
jgi:hypothetical protein